MKTSLIRGLAAAAIAVGGFVPLSAPASAASPALSFSFGPSVRHSQMYMGRQAVQVCQTKYRVSWYKGKPRRIPVGTSCHWEYPNKPILTFRFGGPNDQHNGLRYNQYNQYNQYRNY